MAVWYGDSGNNTRTGTSGNDKLYGGDGVNLVSYYFSRGPDRQLGDGEGDGEMDDDAQ